jgi:hypothetical protein
MINDKYKKKSSSHNNQNDIAHFKLIKSDINLNGKNFVGFDDSDYEIISNLNDSNVSFAVKNNVSVGNSLIIGYENNNINTTNTNNQDNKNNQDNQDNPDNQNNYVLDVNGDTNIDGDLMIKEKLFVGNSVFFNKDIFLPNPIVLEDENISKITELTINPDSLSYSTYKFLLKNILDNTKSSSKKHISSIKFFNNNTNFTQTIIPINKKFIFGDIKIYSFLLSYSVYFKNKIIEVKPIMDTFILINEQQNTFKLVLDTDNNQVMSNNDNDNDNDNDDTKNK